VHELVGREHELATLEQLLETVRNGGSGTLLVHGDPGIGNSDGRFATTLLGVTRLFTPQLLVLLEATAVD
jgi:AAA ATPase domain